MVGVGDEPMYHALFFVEISERLGNLHDDMPAQILREVRQPHNLVKQLSALEQLQDDVIVALAFHEGNQLDDVGVVQAAHNLDFFEDIRSLQPRSLAGVRG